MNARRNATLAGAFIVASVAAIIILILAIGGRSFLDSAREYQVRFELTDDVTGLKPGYDVRIGGVRHGEVSEVLTIVEPEDGSYTLVKFTLPEKYPLRQGAKVVVQGSNIGGTSWLNIANLGGGEPLAPGQTLVGEKAGLFDAVAKLAPQVEATLREVREVTLPKINAAVSQATHTLAAFQGTADVASSTIIRVRGKVDPIVERYNQVADAARELLNTGNQAMGHIRDVTGETKGDLKGTIANLHATTGTLKEKLPTLADKLIAGVDEMRAVVAGVQASLGDLQKTMSSAASLSGELDSVVKANRGKIDNMLSGAAATAKNLELASVELRHSPWRLLYQPGPGELANLNLFDAARSFAVGAAELQQASADLRDAFRDPKQDPERVKRLMAVLEERFTRFQEIEKKLWDAVR